MTESATCRADVIAMGTELTTGASIDSNSAWISTRLGELGILTRRHVTVPDDRGSIVHEVRESGGKSQLIVMTGGLGPTGDDLTREALAEVLGAELVLDEASMEGIAGFYATLGRPMPESNRKQAMVPVGARALPNKWGTAPGVRLRVGGALVFALPGVPREMKAMFEAYISPAVREMPGREQVSIRVVRTYGTGESNLAEQIGDMMTVGRNPSVGTTASEGVISVRVVAKGETESEAAALAERDVVEVRSRLGTLVYAEGEDSLASVVGKLLVDRGETVSTAESCTGGLLGAMLTDVSGSSAYYLGGFVPYSNAQKIENLGVAKEIIEQFGAVSAQCAKAMAEQCREHVQTTHALSITGIAGPTGGTKDKPVGLVYIGLASPEGTTVRESNFSDRLNREVIRDRAARTALNMLRRKLS